MVEWIQQIQCPAESCPATHTTATSTQGEGALLAPKSLSLTTLRGLTPPAELSQRGIVTPNVLLRFGAYQPDSLTKLLAGTL